MVACARFFGYNNRRPEKRNYRYEESHSSRRSRRRMFGVGPVVSEPDADDFAAGTGSRSCARAACAGRAAAGSCPAAGRAACAAGHNHHGAARPAGHYDHGAARPAGHYDHGGARNDRSGACADDRCPCGLSDLPPLRRSRQGGACDGVQAETLQALRRQGLPASSASSTSASSGPSPSSPPALN